jgi:glutamate-1-semialdehyde 2,1-aminomutase
MYIGDMSVFCGHAPAPVVEAVTRRMALGNHFLLPTEDAVVVAEHLAQRYRLPQWQFTLSATQANTEVIRIARQVTGREIVLVFDGKYHGHVDATLVVLDGDGLAPEGQGLPSSVTGQARIVSFNDVPALERALAERDVALVLTEPVMTNAGIINPDPGFHDALRRLTRETGTLLALDETHSLVGAYGGMGELLGLEPDLLTLGKSIAAGVPLGAYGMTTELATASTSTSGHNLVSGEAIPEIATGGTLFANALAMAAARAALTEVLTPAAFERARNLGSLMADGLDAAIVRAGLPWNVARMGTHAYYGFAPSAARDGVESRDNDDPSLRALVRVWMANHGVWESGWWLGPTLSVAHSEADVDQYVATFAAMLADLD